MNTTTKLGILKFAIMAIAAIACTLLTLTIRVLNLLSNDNK